MRSADVCKDRRFPDGLEIPTGGEAELKCPAVDPTQEKLDRLEEFRLGIDYSFSLPSIRLWWANVCAQRRFSDHQRERLYRRYFLNVGQHSTSALLIFLALHTVALFSINYALGQRSLVFGLLLLALLLILMAVTYRTTCSFGRRWRIFTTVITVVSMVFLQILANFYSLPGSTTVWSVAILSFGVFALLPVSLRYCISAWLLLMTVHLATRQWGTSAMITQVN